jgi:serine protease Do
MLKEMRKIIIIVVLISLLSSLCGFLAGFISSDYRYLRIRDNLANLGLDVSEEKEESEEYSPVVPQEQAVIEVVERISPAVVNIIITKDVPVVEKYYINPFGEGFDFEIPQYRDKGTEKQEVGGGSGFIISKDGTILTNKHVVMDEDAEYTVFTNEGEKFPAEVLARDPTQDLAVLQIKEADKDFPVVKLGDSSKLKIGQTVVAIGNALSEFRNTVSVGVISGLGRAVTASGGGIVETIEDVIQTDAAINKGNSGGPLLNLKGEVVGINTATVLNAQNISFAIPINKAKRDIEQVKEKGEITYPFLGIYYTPVTEDLKEEYNLSIDYGAWVGRNKEGEIIEDPIFPDSPAEEIGLRQDDIIIEFDGKKVTSENSLAEIILNYNPGDKINLKILRDGEEQVLEVTLAERQP